MSNAQKCVPRGIFFRDVYYENLLSSYNPAVSADFENNRFDLQPVKANLLKQSPADSYDFERWPCAFLRPHTGFAQL